jgi:hypothetical protein
MRKQSSKPKLKPRVKQAPDTRQRREPIAFDAVQKGIDQLEGGTLPLTPDGKDQSSVTSGRRRDAKGRTGQA